VALSGAMIPGPLLAITIGETTRKGAWIAFLLILGHSLLELVLIIGLAFGLSAFLNNTAVIRLISVLGGGFLIWMGYGMVADACRGRASLGSAAYKDVSGMWPVVQGVATSVSNPYWTIWWATIGLNFMLASLKHGLLGLASFYFGHILGDFLWYMAVAYVISTGKRFITERFYRGILFFFGLFLLFLAAAFILNIPLF